jgi:hypothetical protein
MKTQIPEWARKCFEENCNYAPERRKALERCAIHVLSDEQLKRNENLRNGAVRLIMELLPKTFPVLERLLSDSSSPLWYEVHFTAFNSLYRSDLNEIDQMRLLVLVEQYLMNAKSEAGAAAWKAGDMLGDEWYTPETLQILEKLVLSARYVAGRKGALHGIQHAMDEATPSEMKRIRSLLRKVASEDPSAEVRDYATYTLTDGGCYKESGVRK